VTQVTREIAPWIGGYSTKWSPPSDVAMTGVWYICSDGATTAMQWRDPKRNAGVIDGLVLGKLGLSRSFPESAVTNWTTRLTDCHTFQLGTRCRHVG